MSAQRSDQGKRAFHVETSADLERLLTESLALPAELKIQAKKIRNTLEQPGIEKMSDEGRQALGDLGKLIEEAADRMLDMIKTAGEAAARTGQSLEPVAKAIRSLATDVILQAIEEEAAWRT